MLQFFGSIDAEYTSHDIRGLNVVVRLMKTVVGWTWPQLTAEHVKCHWLSYNYNAINSDDFDMGIENFGTDDIEFCRYESLNNDLFVCVFVAVNHNNTPILDDPDSDDCDSNSDFENTYDDI